VQVGNETNLKTSRYSIAKTEYAPANKRIHLMSLLYAKNYTFLLKIKYIYLYYYTYFTL